MRGHRAGLPTGPRPARRSRLGISARENCESQKEGQVTPARLMQLIGDPDAAKASRAMKAMLQMKKIDIAAIETAAAAR